MIDSGSTVSVLHPDVYYDLPHDLQPVLEPSGGLLRMADGETISSFGTVMATLRVGTQCLKQRMVVANIEAPLVIGFDFLHEHGCVLDSREGTLLVNGEILQCEFEDQQAAVFRVTVEETVTVPPWSQVVVQAQVQGDVPEGQDMIIEPNPDFLARKPILVGRTLVKPKRGRVFLQVANLTDEEQTVYLNSCAGLGELAEVAEDESPVPSDRVAKVNRLPDKVLPDHVSSLLTGCVAQLDDAEKHQVEALLHDFAHVFAKSKSDLGQTKIIEHRINTGDAAPIKQRARRVPVALREEARAEEQRMLEAGIVEPSTSPWASPVVLIRKKDNSLRYCIDYRRLNNVTIKDSYPIPRVDDCLETLGGSHYFSTLDCASGYWQVAMDKQDAAKTAFVTHQGLFQFKVMPFGLCNAPATFERLMEAVLAGLQWESCLVYLDDIIVFSNTVESHIQRLRAVLQRIDGAGLRLSPAKCQLFQTEVKFLGHIVSNRGIETDPDKTRAIREWPRPASLKEVRTFVGKCSYYRKFIRGFSEVCKPLHRLTEKNVVFEWTPACEEAFTKLKEALVTAPILGYPNPEGLFILDTDASESGMGAVLQQQQDGQEKVISNFSRCFSKSERRYCVTRRELLAIVESVKHFHIFLYGRPFLIRSDHGALSWLLRFKNPEGQMARWLEVLGTYDYTIQHRPGRSHGNADGLSRRPCNGCSYCEKREHKSLTEGEDSPSAPVTPKLFAMRGHRDRRNLSEDDAEPSAATPTSEDPGLDGSQPSWIKGRTPVELQDAQRSDPCLAEVIRWKEAKERPAWKDVSHQDRETKSYWAQWDRLDLVDGILRRLWVVETTGEELWQLVVPSCLRDEALESLHDGQCSGHLGMSRTVNRVQLRFYWFNYRKDTNRWCRECQICQKRKNPPKKGKASLGQYRVGLPNERIALDILGPLPESDDGKKYILIIGCYFTKWKEAFAMPNMEAATVADILVNEWISRYGIPRQIHADQGRQFESQLFQQLCERFKIDKTRTTPFHPQSDGMIERFNRTLEEMLSKVVAATQTDWDLHLSLAMLAYRTSTHESTGYSPSMMMLGREAELPVDLLFGPPPQSDPEAGDPHRFVQELEERLHLIHSIAREQLLGAAERQRRGYEIHIQHHRYEIGDIVWLHQIKAKKGVSPKLQMPWDGPFVVIRRLSDLVYQIQEGPRCRLKVVHHNRLKPHYGTPPEWHQKKAAELQPKQMELVDTPVEEHAALSDDSSTAAADIQHESEAGGDRPAQEEQTLGCEPSPVREDPSEETPDSEPQRDVQPPPDETPKESAAVDGRPRRTRRRPAYLDDYDD